MIWSLHYDRATNQPHEFPLVTTVGCDNAAGAGTCGANGLVGGVGGNIWKIRHDVALHKKFENPTHGSGWIGSDPFYKNLLKAT